MIDTMISARLRPFLIALKLAALLMCAACLAYSQTSDDATVCDVKGAQARKAYIDSLPPAKRPRGDPDLYGAFNRKQGLEARQIEADAKAACVASKGVDVSSSEKLLSCRVKADAAGESALKRIYAAEGKKLPRLNLPNKEKTEAKAVSDLAFEECINPNAHKAALSSGAIANEYDADGRHHIVINMGDQVVNAGRAIAPGGTESKILFTTGGQSPRYFFLDEKDGGAVKEVVPGDGEGTYKSKSGTFTIILRDDKVDIYPSKP
jgi:hypothetical protein